MRRLEALYREDPELGTERLCRVCGEWWPLDDDFWYFKVIPAGTVEISRGRPYTRKQTVSVVQGRCKACWAERSAQQYAARKSA